MTEVITDPAPVNERELQALCIDEVIYIQYLALHTSPYDPLPRPSDF